jgi:hypothetical protein
VLANLIDGTAAGENNREDILLADAAGDQLRILRPEIQNND